MKYLLILSSVFMAVNTFAATTCDLNVSVSRLKDAKIIPFILEDSLHPDGKAEDYVENLLSAKLLKECADRGATNCQITRTDTKRNTWGESLIVYATVQGTIVKGGKKLSDNEYAKKRQQAICQKVDSCINTALNDNDSSTNFMEKLYMIKEKTNCNQVENFLFDN